MPNLRFYITRGKRYDKAGASPVFCRFYASRKIDLRAKTPIFAPLDLWDVTTQRCKLNKRFETPANARARNANKQIEELSAYIFQRYSEQKNGFSVDWLQSVVNDYFNPNQRKELPLSEVVADYCTARNVAPSTRRKLLSLQTLLTDFGTPLYASQITTRQLEQFATYLRQTNHSENSTAGRLRQLRTLVYWYGKPTPNPFETFSMPREVYGTPIYLTQEERDYLAVLPDLSESKKVQRDIFIFHCHIGCRVSDLYQLTPANVTKDGWLIYVPQKTAKEKPQTVEVPLSPTALAIIERYKDTDTRGRLLPFISVMKYNDAIRYICKAAALDRSVMVRDKKSGQTTPRPLYEVVTTHTARKTFTQIIYSATPNQRLVASLTGHSENSRAFARYTTIDKDMKQRAVLDVFRADIVPTRNNKMQQITTTAPAVSADKHAANAGN